MKITSSFGRVVLATLGLFATAASAFASGTHYYVNDHLATTVGIADAAGEIAALEADAFGSPIAAGANPGRYTGKPYDEDMGAYVFPFRNYRAEEARWMSADPSGFPDGVNERSFAAIPTLSVDPFGLNIHVLHNTNGAHGAGHTGLIIGSGSTFTYYSYGDASGGTLTTSSHTTLSAAVNAAGADHSYNRWATWNTSAAEDAAAAAYAQTWDGTEYNVLDHNCVQMVDGALNAAGRTTVDYGVPNLWFNSNKTLADRNGTGPLHE